MPAQFQYLRVEIRALLHESANGEPKRIGESEIIFESLSLDSTGVRRLPLEGTEPCHHEYRNRHCDVRRQDVQPDLDRQWIHKAK